MPYCDLITDVLPHVPHVEALRDLGDPSGLPPTKPTLAQAESLRSQVEQEIDSHLRRRGIATPVTSDAGVLVLMPIAATGTAAQLMVAAFPHRDGIGGDGGASGALADRYAQMLAFIDEGGLDAALGSGGDGGSDGSYYVSHRFPEWTSPLAGDSDWQG